MRSSSAVFRIDLLLARILCQKVLSMAVHQGPYWQRQLLCTRTKFIFIMTMLSAPEGIDCRSQRPASCLPWPPCSRPSSASPPSAASTTCAAWKLEHPKLSLLSPVRRGRHLDPPGCCTLCYELRRQRAVQVKMQLHLQMHKNTK